MQDISKNTIITLNNNEGYFVASITDYKDSSYALLINVNKDDDNMIVKKIIENNEVVLEVVDNKIELSSLQLLLQENLD